MAYSEQIRNEVKERLKKGEKAKQISNQTGISIATIYKWKKELEIKNNETNKQEEKSIKGIENDIQEKEGDSIIQSQMITIAKKEGKLEEAKIGNETENIQNELLEEDNEKQKSPILNQIAAKLYYNKIEEKDIEEIISSRKISQFQKNVMLLAIYEKQKDVEKAKQLIKKYKNENKGSSRNKKVLNEIMQRIQSKKVKIFDYQFYHKLLHWKIDPDLKERYEQEQKSEMERKREERRERAKSTILPTTTKVAKRKDSNANRGQMNNPYTRIQRDDRQRKSFRESIRVKQNISTINEVSQEVREVDHFHGIMDYLKEKRRFIYLKMQSMNPQVQRTGISQWDKMETLMKRVNENRENKDYLNQLYEKISELKEKENGMDR